MPRAELTDGRIEIETHYVEKEMVKLVPGSRWDPHKKIWTTPLSWAACVQLRGIFGDALVVGPSLTQWSIDEVRTRIAPTLAVRSAIALHDDDDSDIAKIVRSW